jgi:hypothetical protein
MAKGHGRSRVRRWPARTKVGQLLPLCVLISIATAPLACGRKAPPRPPEDVLPMPIADLRAKSISTGVELAWSRPTRYADGDRMIDLAGMAPGCRSRGHRP